ncbi:MAG: hypothetical protein GX643_17135 [Acidimicrobiales bacterium]|nr:hypothetical protein [Acidimicrobiales bacterium]
MGIVALSLLVAACEWVPVRTFDETSQPAFTFHHLTRDGADGYLTSASKGHLKVSAATTNTGTNTRTLIVPAGQPLSTEQQSCATWEAQTGVNTQQGLALRVRHDDAEGRWRAVTVTKNVMWGANWQFNVLTWDSRQTGWQMHGSVNLAPVFWPDQQLAPLPWRICARVEGDLVRVKGWRVGQPEPSWDDPGHSGSVRLPAGWIYPSTAGWYVGHLAPGGSTTMSGLVLDRLELR